MNNRWAELADSELVVLINKGDSRAFDELFLRHKRTLYRHAYRMIPDTELCNDILQDVFLSLWAKRGKWKLQTTPLAYLYHAIRNKILDHISHEKVVARYMDELIDFGKQGQCFTEDYLLERELLALIEEKKADLPKRTKEIFELNKEQHLTYKEIADKLAISEHTAKKQVHNALRYLRAKLTLLLFFTFLLFFLLF
ncbi:RNA polymerase sigma factor [Sphingobacterium corticis]|uniref:RNA polymerase sigma factor n=1 Tax=Sphingobacterium corticis TaxID=1812823 RepID=A0ABW5NK89_9SPHI